MVEVIGTELLSEAIRRAKAWGVHHTGIIDQQVDAWMGGQQLGRRQPDRIERGKVERLDGNITGDAGCCLLAFLNNADGSR